MSGFTFGTYALLGSASQSVAADDSHVMGTVDNAGKIATELSIAVTYHASATAGAQVQIERDLDGTNFEGENSAPWVVPIPFAADTTRERVITIPGDQVGKFQVRVVNLDADQALTVTTRTKQATFGSA